MNKTMTSNGANNNECTQAQSKKTKLNSNDLSWALSLFGTAVGAGILFLPINAGLGGFWPLVFCTLLIGPMTFLSHRGLTRLVLSSKRKNADIIDVIEEHFGKHASLFVAALYFFVFYPILLIYGISITNTVESFMINQMGLVNADNNCLVPRWLLSITLISAMVVVMTKSRRLMLKVTSSLVYPLTIILGFLSLYLIPSWNTSSISISNIPDGMTFLNVVWVTLPVLVFSFNHAPAISSFAVAQKETYDNQADRKAEHILRVTTATLLVFIMFFVFSCVMTLSPEQILEAKHQNVSVLSYLANIHGSPLISLFGPLIALIAIVSSFFGHYLGTLEGLKGFVKRLRKDKKAAICERSLNTKITVFMIASIWGITMLNPSVLGMIETLGGPIIAGLLYLMPMYAVYKVPALKKFRQSKSNLFVIMMGLLAMTATFMTAILLLLNN
jgi:serine transporter